MDDHNFYLFVKTFFCMLLDWFVIHDISIPFFVIRASGQNAEQSIIQSINQTISKTINKSINQSIKGLDLNSRPG